MLGSLLEEYDRVLERLENLEGVSKTMVFHVLAIHEKTVLDKLMELSDKELVKILQKSTEEIVEKLTSPKI